MKCEQALLDKCKNPLFWLDDDDEEDEDNDGDDNVTMMLEMFSKLYKV